LTFGVSDDLKSFGRYDRLDLGLSLRELFVILNSGHLDGASLRFALLSVIFFIILLLLLLVVALDVTSIGLLFLLFGTGLLLDDVLLSGWL
jgi:hypothetical protein